MIVHHLNCATMCPLGGRALTGSGGLITGSLVAHCLLVESKDGLILVDTGLAAADTAASGRLPLGMRMLARPMPRPEQTALHQVRHHGYRPEDVRDIVLTHLDLDHAGGLPDFPHARVHVLAPELDAARRRSTTIARNRYLSRHWRHGPQWVAHELGGETWFGLPATAVVDNILLVPLPGHTHGHSGVAVRQPGGWLLHSGDAYFHHDQLRDHGRAPLGLAAFQRLSDTDHRARLDSLHRLRTLHAHHSDEVRIFCAHDPHELSELRRAAAEPTVERGTP
ncbi:MBL fold metallo-hydrolase [Nocardia otitidiscaviarum]|nr:MBL fold metallo-hydrolase [Nocardia otitidiscaviarum]